MLGRVGVVTGRVVVPAFVGGYDHPAVLRQPLHPLFHPAIAMRAPVIAPGMKAIFDNLLAIFAPFVAVIKNIDIAPGLETKPRLPQLSSHLHLVLVT